MDDFRTRITGQCLHCKRDGLKIISRRLCVSCYRIDSIRNRYPASDRTKPLLPDREPCRHCKVRNGIPCKRGLCVGCYGSQRIRELYVSRRVKDRVEDRAEPDEPTMEQLEAIIAERMKNLPKWWHQKQAAHGEGYLPDPLPRALAFTRGVRAFNRRRGRE